MTLVGAGQLLMLAVGVAFIVAGMRQSARGRKKVRQQAGPQIRITLPDDVDPVTASRLIRTEVERITGKEIGP